ncbi:hypothetical protein V6N11_064164 [Hibiscus sabdariffa]|uniref:Uncharacterized protein n=2 Tax=Hibiscus sabdariffa TaxID=183260 RepID=A0ABR2PN45_9ROSI
MAGILVIFDFDKTIIDCDSDNWVVDELGFTEFFNQLLPTMPWNSLMDKMMEEIHARGKTIDDIVEGMVIEKIQASLEGKKKIIYLGDGSGDYCPSLKLGEADYMMPRKDFPVWDLICRNPVLIKAEIHGWSDGEELEKVLLKIIDTVAVEGDDDKSSLLISSVDCKSHTVSASTTALPQALPVPQ